MRWIFRDPNADAETVRRERICQRIESWWAAFRTKTEDLDRLFRRQAGWDLPRWMHDHLQVIDAALMWEYGAGPKGGHQLVITPESDRHLRPLVNEILRCAPAIDGWSFSAYRLPQAPEQASAFVEARTGRQLDARTRVKVQRGPHHTVRLTWQIPGCASSEDTAAHDVAFVGTETLLGEEILDHWIGAIEVVPLPGLMGGLFGAGRSAVPAKDLKERVDAVIGSIVDQLPATPLTDVKNWPRNPDKTIGAVLRRNPAERQVYPGRSDLMVMSTAFSDLSVNTIDGTPFCSTRYSKVGESFCYLKTDGTEGLEATPWPDRASIEEAIGDALEPGALGCVIAGGTGRVYSYIDLAVTNVEKASAAIREVLRKGHIHRNTWLLFLDNEWRDEWIGIYDDTPPPP